MRNKEGKLVPPAADVLVCFPARAHHLSLMPKTICSSARPSEPSTGLRKPRHGMNSSTGSPLLWAKRKPDHISEPTSPKVTCAGQIKVRPKPNQCKNCQSVIERIHNHRKQKKRSPWIEPLGFKKDVIQFLTCLRNLRCFGVFPSDESRNYPSREEETDRNSNDVFSKWFMILQENQGSEFADKEDITRKTVTPYLADDDCPPPPPNALLLMRCRSAPAGRGSATDGLSPDFSIHCKGNMGGGRNQEPKLEEINTEFHPFNNVVTSEFQGFDFLCNLDQKNKIDD